MVSVAAAVIATAALARTVSSGVAQPFVAGVFLVFIALGELVRLRLAAAREAAPVGAAVALAYCLLPQTAGTAASHEAAQAVAVVVAGMFLGVLPHVLVGRPPRTDHLARRIVVIAVVAALFRPLTTSHRAVIDLAVGPGLALTMVVTVGLAVVADALLAAIGVAATQGSPFGAAARDEANALAGIGSAIGATGILIALALAVMGLWALPVLCAPLLATQFSFRRFAMGRATYRQTVGALSRMTDLGGHTVVGHAARVAGMSVAVGRALGLSGARALDLEHAALMHDLGQLGLVGAIPGGATTLLEPGERRRIARSSAAVAAATSGSASITGIVARQADPYRPDGAQDPTLPLEARILKVVNAFDDLGGGSPFPLERLGALERLRLDTSDEYDPVVVEALVAVVRRSMS